MVRRGSVVGREALGARPSHMEMVPVRGCRMIDMTGHHPSWRDHLRWIHHPHGRPCGGDDCLHGQGAARAAGGGCWGLVLKCYELRTRQHKMLNDTVLRP
jgi:hypothetical protein